MSPSHEKKRKRSAEDFEEPRKKKHKSSKQGCHKPGHEEGDSFVTVDDDDVSGIPEKSAIVALDLDEKAQCEGQKTKKKKKKKKKKTSSFCESNVDVSEICRLSDSDKWLQNSKSEQAPNAEANVKKNLVENPLHESDSKPSDQNIVSTKAPTTSVNMNCEVPLLENEKQKKGLRSVSSEIVKITMSDYEDDDDYSNDDVVRRKNYFKTAINSYPSAAKGNAEQESRRLMEFKCYNKVSCGAWQKICDNLKTQGKVYKTGRFSKEENEQLAKNWKKITKNCPFANPHILLMKNMHPDKRKDIEKYINETDFYIRLGKHLNRPLYSVYSRARRAFHPGNFKGSYTEEEDKDLLKMFNHEGTRWQKNGQVMGRSGQSLCDRFKLIKSNRKTGRWSKEEDDQLIASVKSQVLDYSDPSEAFYNYPWSVIAKAVPSRTPNQCRLRWVEVLALGSEAGKRFPKNLQLQLIHEIIKLNVDHESEIDWIQLMSKFNISSPQYLQRRWRRLRNRISNFENFTLSEVLEKLEGILSPHKISGK